MNIKFDTAASIFASASLGFVVAMPFFSNLGYNRGFGEGVKKGTTQGIEKGIVQGRQGYVPGYNGGTVAIEGYDGLGHDFNCANNTWVYRGPQPGNLKPGVEYTYSDIRKVFPMYASFYKRQAESVCRSLGHKP